LARNVVAQVEQPTDLDLQARLFCHFAAQGFVQPFSRLNTATGQGP